ncbi:MAG: ABC transporter substrate-binding protein [Deltaproteobacteria bacterium]|nr:MAG: ABC transporter substrate-binding protein [Deltaproteobacteria bacterium]
MKLRKNVMLMIGILMAVSLPMLLNCAKKEVGVTEDEILVGVWSAQTGPAALWGAVARGTDCYFKMINDEGGIHGRKLKLLIRDDGYQPARTKAVVKELVEKDGVFAFVGGLGTATGMAVKDYLHANKIPSIAPATGSQLFGNPPTRYLFTIYPTYTTEGSLLTKYAVETLKSEKIAFFYQNDDYGEEGLKGAEDRLAKYNMELVAKVSVEITDTDLSSHVLKLRESEADTVIMFLLPKQAAMTLKEATKLDFKPKWLTTSTLSDVDVMNKITGGLWEGVFFDNWAELPNSDHPLMVKYREVHKKYAPKEHWGVFFAAGFVFAEPFVEALRRVGRDLTREKLVEAMESIKNWNGGSTHNVTFGPNLRQGTNSIFIGKCENGRAVRISDWMEIEQ